MLGLLRTSAQRPAAGLAATGLRSNGFGVARAAAARTAGASVSSSLTATAAAAAANPFVSSMGARRGWHAMWPLFKRTGKSKSDQAKRELVQEYELERRLYKSMVHNQHLDPVIRAMAQHQLSAGIPRNSSLTRTVNRCVWTGRARSVYRWSRMSRLTIRDMMTKGLMPGVHKSTW